MAGRLPPPEPTIALLAASARRTLTLGALLGRGRVADLSSPRRQPQLR